MRLPLLLFVIVATQVGLSGAANSQTSRGKATYYWQPQKTASGERFRPDGMTAAHRTLPLGTKVRVTHLGTKRAVLVRINDRGPFTRGIAIDLSRGAARELGMLAEGIAAVEIAVVR
jgi:rare lipoprotein A